MPTTLNNSTEFDWITKSYVENLVNSIAKNDKTQSNNPNRIEVIKFTLEPATKKGDNYASDMVKCKVWYRNALNVEGARHEKTIILKIIPSGEIQLKILVKCNIFPREIHAYNDVVSEVQRCLRSIGDHTKISPRCLFTQTEPKMMLAFEDLKEQNYQMYDRKLLLDLDHTLLVIQKLAKLHAASTIVFQNNPASMNSFLEGSISTNPDRQDFLVFFEMAANTLQKQTEKWGPEWHTIASKLKNFGQVMISRSIELYKRDDRSLNVFNHNDVWINNLMFRYESGRANDVLLLDYQLSCWGSPAIDLNYFLYGSVKDDVREKNFDKLIRVYFDTLHKTLRYLRPDGVFLSLQDILWEMEKKGFLAVNVALCLMPLNMMENTDNCSLDLLLQATDEGEAFRETIFSNPNYVEYIKKRLPVFLELGYLD